VIKAYSKAVHPMAFVNTLQPDQTDLRHGWEAKEGTAVHSFPISTGVATTRDKCDCKRGYSETPG
jgi:hypothetical protein